MSDSNKMKTYISVACDDNGGIGKSGIIPWPHLNEDMTRFKLNTIGNGDNAVLMGRVTWESLPKHHRPLKDRMNIIVSRTLDPKTINEHNVRIFKTCKEAYDWCYDLNFDALWVIGGEQIYSAFTGSVDLDGIFLCHVSGDYVCDRYAPNFEEHGYSIVDESEVFHKDDIKYRFIEYILNGK